MAKMRGKKSSEANAIRRVKEENISMAAHVVVNIYKLAEVVTDSLDANVSAHTCNHVKAEKSAKTLMTE